MTKYAIKYTFGILIAALLLAAAAPPAARAQIFDDEIYTFVLFDQLEIAPAPSGRPVGLEATSWIGGDINRLWLRAEGEQLTDGEEGEAEIEALYGRLITPFFDAVAGARLDARWGAEQQTRGFLAVGLQGLAPYWFEVEPTLYVSQDGDVSAQLVAAYELLFTQRLILEPEFQVGLALQEVPEWGVGSGLNDVTAGLRLRYEISRKFAPYVGVSWMNRFGDAADFAEAEGEEAAELFFVVGVRMWR